MNNKDYIAACGTIRCLERLLDSVSDENLRKTIIEIKETFQKAFSEYPLVMTQKMSGFNDENLTDDEIFRMATLKVRQMMLLNPDRKEELKTLYDFIRNHRLQMKMKGR